MTALGAALVEGYGVGCPGTDGFPPEIAGEGAPRVGDGGFRVHLESGRATTAGLLSVGTGAVDVPFGGCRLPVAPILFTLAAATDAAGGATIPFPIPNDPALAGLDVFMQWAVVDPQGAAFDVLAFSDGLAVMVGR